MTSITAHSSRLVALAIALVTTLAVGLLSPLSAHADGLPAWTFNSAGNLQGWSIGNGVTSLTATSSALVAEVTGNDPWIKSSAVSFDSALANTVVISAQNATANTTGKLYWTTTAQPNFSEARSATFPLLTNEFIPSEYRVDLRGISTWAGTITGIRLDPGENATAAGTVSIASIGFALNEDELPTPEDDDRVPVPHIGTVNPVSASASVITVHGSATLDSGESFRLYELDAWEYEADVASGALIGTQTASGSFSFAVTRFDGARDRINSKFLVVVASAGEPVSGYEFVDSPRYVTDFQFPSANDFAFPDPPTKKGLQVQLTDDAEVLGVGHAAINISLDNAMLVASRGASDTIEFVVDGQTYYFNKSYMESLDREIKPLSDNGMVVNAILILYKGSGTPADSAVDLLIHPDAAVGQGIVYAFNTVDDNSRYFRAALAFLADRYSRVDQANGRVVGWIVGNEVDSAWVWGNAGETTMKQYVDDYERAVRWTHIATHLEYAGARVYISLDHNWTATNDASQPYRYYSGRAVLDQMAVLMVEAGNFPWNIAYHPYPENLFNPATWNDTSATNSDNSPKVTFKNLGVLTAHLAQAPLVYEGAQRRVILSEQGFNAPSNSQADQDLQAAAYAYAYFRVISTPGIDSFILHRHVDHQGEGGLRLGLWTWDDNAAQINTPGSPRRIYDVFRDIDTPAARAATAFALPIIGASSWEALFPGIDIEGSAVRPVPAQLPADRRASAVVGTITLPATDWAVAENSQEVSATGGVAHVGFDALGSLWRGGVQRLSSPANVSASPYFQVGVTIPSTAPVQPYMAMIRVYSGDDVAYGSVAVPAGASVSTLNLTGWAGAASVDRVKVWIRGTSNTNWSGEYTIDSAGFVTTPAAVVDTAGESGLPATTKVLYNFEGSSQGWVAGTTVSSVSTSTSIANSPGTPRLGQYTLSAVTPMAPANQWRSVLVNRAPLSIANARSLVVHVNAYGGMGSSYQARVQIVTTSDTEEYVTTVTPDQWNRVEMPLDGVTGDITQIAVSFRAVGVTTNWNPQFQVDYVALQLDEVLYDFEGSTQGWVAGANVSSVGVSTSIANSPGTPRLGGYTLSAVTPMAPADQWRSVLVTRTPLSIAGATAVVAHVNAYGGMGSTYQARVQITTTSDTEEYVTSIQTDKWNRVSLPLAGVTGNITQIVVSFRAVGVTTNWNPQFQVDYVALAR